MNGDVRRDITNTNANEYETDTGINDFLINIEVLPHVVRKGIADVSTKENQQMRFVRKGQEILFTDRDSM